MTWMECICFRENWWFVITKVPYTFAVEIVRTKSLVPKIKDVKVAACSWWLQAGPVFLPFTTERSWVLTASSANTVPKACWHGCVNF